MSGHSKWSQIKHKKALTDAKKGKVFSKMSREITTAAKNGSANPEFNMRLRSAIDRARTAGIPKDNIERALQKVAGGEENSLHEFIYEALGPGGISIIIEGITDNTNRSFNEIKLLLAKHNAKIVEQGSLIWNFEKMGIIILDKEENKTIEKMEEIILDSRAVDFQETKDLWMVETSFASLAMVKKYLEERKIFVKEIKCYYKAKTTLDLKPEEKTCLDALLDALENHDDVQEINTNLKNWLK